jgi:hypothetical protein
VSEYQQYQDATAEDETEYDAEVTEPMNAWTKWDGYGQDINKYIVGKPMAFTKLFLAHYTFFCLNTYLTQFESTT